MNGLVQGQREWRIGETGAGKKCRDCRIPAVCRVECWSWCGGYFEEDGCWVKPGWRMETAVYFCDWHRFRGEDIAWVPGG